MPEYDGSVAAANTDAGDRGGRLNLLRISAVWLQTVHHILRAESGCELSAKLVIFAMVMRFYISGVARQNINIRFYQKGAHFKQRRQNVSRRWYTAAAIRANPELVRSVGYTGWSGVTENRIPHE